MRNNKQAMNNYAWFLATSSDSKCRNPEKAVRIFYQLKNLYTSADEIIPWHVWDTESACKRFRVRCARSSLESALCEQLPHLQLDKFMSEGDFVFSIPWV